MFDYGFDKLSNKLYEALTAYPPDFTLAQRYINEGADIHACGKDDNENILAQIILGSIIFLVPPVGLKWAMIHFSMFIIYFIRYSNTTQGFSF